MRVRVLQEVARLVEVFTCPRTKSEMFGVCCVRQVRLPCSPFIARCCVVLGIAWQRSPAPGPALPDARLYAWCSACPESAVVMDHMRESAFMRTRYSSRAQLRFAGPGASQHAAYARAKPPSSMFTK